MSTKKNGSASSGSSLPALKIGSRVRCLDDGVEGRITWANGVSVKVQWDDGEHVTWRRDSLAARPLAILDPADKETSVVASGTADNEEPSVSNSSPYDEAAPLATVAAEGRTEPLPPTPEMTADVAEPTPAEQVSPIRDAAEVQMPAVSDDTVEAAVPSQRRRKASAAPKEKKAGALDAALKVLAEAGQPLHCQEMIVAMAEKGYWTSPGGKTPHATLYSAILREITTKGTDSRFVKAQRGKFTLANPA